MNQRGSASVSHQLAAQSNQPARRDAELHAHAAGIVIDHFFHFTAAVSQQFHYDADEILGAIHHQQFEGLPAAAVFGAHYDFRFPNHEFVTLTAHGFNQDRRLQFPAAQHAKGVRGSGIFYTQRHVGEQFLFQARANVARSDELALAAREGRGIDGENHRERGFINGKRSQGRGIREIRDALAYLYTFHARNCDDISSSYLLSLVALQTAEREEFGNLRRLNRVIQFRNCHLRAALQCPLKYARDGNASQKIAVIEIGYLNLQRCRRIAGWRRNGFDDLLEQRLQRSRVVAHFQVSNSCFSVRINDGKIELVFGGIEINEQ